MTGGAEPEPLIRPPRLDVQRAGTANRLELFSGSLLLVGAYTLAVLALAVYGTAASRKPTTTLAGTHNA